MEYLDFELPLKELEDQLDKCNVIGDESKVDVRDTCKKLKLKIEKTKKVIYSNISPWQRVQSAIQVPTWLSGIPWLKQQCF